MNKGKGYGIHNFHIPNDEMRKMALGTIAGSAYRIKNVLKVIPSFFDKIDAPSESDWLYNQQEEGQTYDTYLGQMHNIIDQKRSKIYIVPLQDNIPLDFLKRLQKYCQAFYFGVPIVLHKVLDITKLGVKNRQNNGKLQYNAKQILKALQRKIPKDAFCLMGVCITDLYHKQEWNFVFGLASLKQRTGVFSFARYDQGFFNEQKHNPDYDVLYQQAVGVLVHEIGHMFGIRHCVYNKCIMNGSNHLQQSKKKPLQLCPVCLRKLQSNAKFDMYQRYKAVKRVLDQQCKGNKAQRTLTIVNEILQILNPIFNK